MDVQSSSASSADLAAPQETSGSNAQHQTTPPLSLSLVNRDGNHIDIEVRRPDGYVNATKLCQAMGKEWKNYFAVGKTKEFLTELSEVEQMPVENLAAATIPSESCLVELGKNRFQNTWVHPDVAIHLAQWASPRFGVAVSRLVRRYQTGQVTTEESLAASRALAGQISFVDSAELEKHRIDAHAKLELEKYKYQADVEISGKLDLEKYRIDAEITAKLETDKHNLSCDSGNAQYYRKLEHEKEMAAIAHQTRMESLEYERQLLEQFGYPMRFFLTASSEDSIGFDSALEHYNRLSGRVVTKKDN